MKEISQKTKAERLSDRDIRIKNMYLQFKQKKTKKGSQYMTHEAILDQMEDTDLCCAYARTTIETIIYKK